MTTTLTSESLETRVENLTCEYLRANAANPAGGFRRMDEDTEPAGDYCSVSAVVEDSEPLGPGLGWKEIAVTVEYRRGDRLESSADDLDARAFDARWASIICALDGMTATDLREPGSCNTMWGSPYFVETEERENEDTGRVRSRTFMTISGLINPAA